MREKKYSGSQTAIVGIDTIDSAGKKQFPKLIYREGDINWVIDNLPREEVILNNGDRILTCSIYTWDRDLNNEGYRIIPFLKIKGDESKAVTKTDILKFFKAKEDFHIVLEKNFPEMYKSFKNIADDYNSACFDTIRNYGKAVTKIAIEHNKIRERLKSQKEELKEKIRNNERIKEKGAYIRAVDHIDHWFLKHDLIVGRDQLRSDIPIIKDKRLSDQQGLLGLKDDSLVYINIGLNGSLPLMFVGKNTKNLEAVINGRNPIINLKNPSYQLTYLLLGMEKITQIYEEIELPDTYMVLEYPSI